MKRLFIATPVITLSAEIQKISADLRFRLRHDNIVWVKDDVRHLTLRFLGYGIKLQDPAQGKEIFKSVAVMADFIQKNRKK